MARLACVLATLGSCSALRMERKSGNGGSCASIGCGNPYTPSLPCQCNDKCGQYGNCCSDYSSLCSGSSPSPPGGAGYWAGVNLDSMSQVAAKMNSGTTKLSYSGVWTMYKSAWVGLPGAPCSDGVFDVYSLKCWTPGSGQCGTYRTEGDCYNREHSWPKSWWGGSKNTAYTDIHHVVPSDGYVNGRRSSHPFGTVTKVSYTSSEGHKVGSCACGTCFEPTVRTKGFLARAHLYFTTRYSGRLSGSTIDSCSLPAVIQWAKDYPPGEWEVEFNNRAQEWQGNRNVFIDFPEKVVEFFG